MDILEAALARGERTLSEHDSKRVLASVGIPVVDEEIVDSPERALAFARRVGYPVVLKGSGPGLAHKTEADLVRLNLASDEAVRAAYVEIVARAAGKLDGVLVQRMVRGRREFLAGMTRDSQFGPCVVFGLGGVLTEALKDVSFRVAPLTPADADEMTREVRAKILLGPFRGEPEVDRGALASILVSLGRLGLEEPAIREIDVNPLIIEGSRPVAVDALIVLDI